MSLIPADESESRGRDGDVVAGARSTSLVARTVSCVRSWVHSGVSALRSYLSRDRTIDGEQAATERTRSTSERDGSPRVVTTTEPVVHDSERNRADIRVDTGTAELFTQPPEGDDANAPRPVGTVDGDTLELTLPDNDDASITSDVWERVER
jgi:hypothetical protein